MKARWFRGAVGFLLLGATCGVALAQSPPDPDYVRQQVFGSYDAFKAELASISATADPVERSGLVDELWQSLLDAGQAPYAQDGSVAFLYRGSASSVQVAGDHTRWSPRSLSPVAGTDLWIREGTLPDDARVDYKLIRNGSWVLDPNNPLQVWSGFGPNSELRMPAYDYAEETIRRPGVGEGALSPNVRINSANLGYSVNYRVYTPAGYAEDELADLPVVYVTDGHEYEADFLGSLSAVLDNLIDDGTIRPTMAVYIDPRNPFNAGENRRFSEYAMNRDFARFVADEVVPAVDGAYRTADDPGERVILGTSMGGLNSAYFGSVEGDTFHKIAIQSPAFQITPAIYDAYRQAPTAPLEIYMTAGTINDGSGGPTMAAIFDEFGYDYTFAEANEGHSWGNWRAQLAEILIDLVGPAALEGDVNADGVVDAADFVAWREAGTSPQAAYESWRENFGSSGTPAVDAVPEPTTATLAVIVLLISACRVNGAW